MSPLPPLAPDNTQRTYVIYTSGGIEHTAIHRWADGVGTGAIFAALVHIMNGMAGLIDSTDDIIGAEYSAKNSNIRFPFTGFTPIPGTNTGGINNEVNQTAKVSLVGKGTDGRLVRWDLYHLAAAFSPNLRSDLGSLLPVYQNWFNSIAATPGGFRPVNIGGATPTLHTYVNFERNSYWEAELR